MNNKLVVLSYDALQSTDLDKLKTMPYFSKILEKAAVVRNMKEIYPTLTFPIHTTMITGAYPSVHGITHNQQHTLSEERPDFSIMGSNWYWEKKHIKIPTLIDELYDASKTVATAPWPVTAGDKRGLNLPEIWPNPNSGEDVRTLFERTSSKEVFDRYYDDFIGRYSWNNNEDMVNYSVDIALDILEKDKPDVLFCHVINLDHVRHFYGVEGREVDECLRQLDIITGRFIEATMRAGTFEDTNFVILGDHGQMDVKGVFFLNRVLADYGLIDIAEDNTIIDHKAYSFSAGFSAQVFTKNGQSIEEVGEILEEIKSKYPEYIDAVYTRDEALKMGLEDSFSFVLESADGILFGGNEMGKTIYSPISDVTYRIPKAMHGYHPSKGTKPPFVAMGPDIASGVYIENGEMINVAPTLAKLTGVHLEHAVGEPLNILKDEDVKLRLSAF